MTHVHSATRQLDNKEDKGLSFRAYNLAYSAIRANLHLEVSLCATCENTTGTLFLSTLSYDRALSHWEPLP